MNGTAATLAVLHLSDTDHKSSKLDPSHVETFHHITAQLFYLCKCTCPNIQTTVAYLCTRVSNPNQDDWKKLGQCIKYLWGNPNLSPTLEVSDDISLWWWVDVSFAVHHDMHSQTRATVSMGRGNLYLMSVWQCINTKSSNQSWTCGGQWCSQHCDMDAKFPHSTRFHHHRQHHLSGQPEHNVIREAWGFIKW